MPDQLRVDCSLMRSHRQRRQSPNTSGLHPEQQAKMLMHPDIHRKLDEVIQQIENNKLTVIYLECHDGQHQSVAIAVLLYRLVYNYAHIALTTEQCAADALPRRFVRTYNS